MSDSGKSLKEKARLELQEFVAIFLYLLCSLGILQVYRYLVELTDHDLSVQSGFVVVKALIGAKVILLGQHLRVTKRQDGRPLIFPTLYRAFVFSCLMGAFSVLECVVVGWIHHHPWYDSLRELTRLGGPELLCRNLILFLSLIPFFACQQINAALEANGWGEGFLWNLCLVNGQPKPGAPPES